MDSSHVGKSMSRVFAALALALALVACGGKKNGKTTPTAGGGTGDTAGTTDPTDPGGGAGGTGGTGGGPVGGGPTPGGPGGGPVPDPTGPPVVPPNFDTDPAQVKTQVDGHIASAKSALSMNPPDGDRALQSARAALALDATNVDAAAYVAFAYYHKRLYDTAELVLDDLFRRDAAKKNANVFYVYGLVYDKTNRPERAFKAYEQAVAIDGNHQSALVNLGVHQLKNSQYSAAEQTFEKLTKQFNRSDAITLTSLGSAYRGRSADFPPGASDRDQFVRQAEGAYKRALQANSDYGPAYYNLGLLYLDTDPFPGVADPLTRLQAAKSYFDNYKNKPGFDVKLYDSRTKDVDKAIKRVQKLQKKKEKDKKNP
jgi:tetratricopeptide (TPR) repeat protein